jgi:hypothetical protein
MRQCDTRLSVRKIRDVLRLKREAHLSDRQIAAVLGSARSTVQECLKRARLAGLSWPLSAELGDEELGARLYSRAEIAPRYPTPDFAAIQIKLARARPFQSGMEPSDALQGRAIDAANPSLARYAGQTCNSHKAPSTVHPEGTEFRSTSVDAEEAR